MQEQPINPVAVALEVDHRIEAYGEEFVIRQVIDQLARAGLSVVVSREGDLDE